MHFLDPGCLWPFCLLRSNKKKSTPWLSDALFQSGSQRTEVQADSSVSVSQHPAQFPDLQRFRRGSSIVRKGIEQSGKEQNGIPKSEFNSPPP